MCWIYGGLRKRIFHTVFMPLELISQLYTFNLFIRKGIGFTDMYTYTVGYITIMSDFQINQCYMAFSNTSSSRSTIRLILTDKVVNAKVSFQI